MLRIDFREALTALEIRDPSLKVCKEIANNLGLYVTFDQPQQPALDGRPGQRNRQRIGNGKHKNWYINYQLEETHVSRPTVVGRIALMAPIDPDNMQFGGFDYGVFGEPEPKYGYMTIHTPSELGRYRPIDPSPETLELTHLGLIDYFVEGHQRLFDVVSY